MENGRSTASLPEITTISSEDLNCDLFKRKTSRIFLLARFRAGEFPIFFEAIIPNLLQPYLLLIQKMVQIEQTLFFSPWFKTFWNSLLFNILSFFLYRKLDIYHKANLFRPFRLLRANTFRPPTVALLARNPCTRFLFKFFG